MDLEYARAKIKDMRVFVTGADGFIGRRLTDILSESGAIISTFDAVPTNDARLSFGITGDLRDRSSVENALATVRPEIVFHLAALRDRSAEMTSFQHALEVNLTGSMNLFAAIKDMKEVRRVVVIGTAEEYGNNQCPFEENMRESPVSAYSFSKMCMTRLCETLHVLYGLPFVILRPTLAYGPGQGIDMFLPSLINSLLKGETFGMTQGEQSRDFVYIDDLVDAFVRSAVTDGIDGMILNIGSGSPVKLIKLARMVESMIGKGDLLRVGERNYRLGEIMDYYVDNSRARRLLGWEPLTDLEDGLGRTIDSFIEKLP